MIIHNVAQRSPEWYALRNRPTASNASKVITSSGKKSDSLNKYLAGILAAKAGFPQEIYQSDAMLNGIAHEPTAKSLYEFVSGNDITEVGFVTLTTSEFCAGCSPDGLVGEDGLLEIKCPTASTFLNYLLDTSALIATYSAQVQFQLYVTERKWCDLFAYSYELKKHLSVRIERNEVFIQTLASILAEAEEKLTSIWENVA